MQDWSKTSGEGQNLAWFPVTWHEQVVSFQVPAGMTGTLVSWPEGGRQALRADAAHNEFLATHFVPS